MRLMMPCFTKLPAQLMEERLQKLSAIIAMITKAMQTLENKGKA